MEQAGFHVWQAAQPNFDGKHNQPQVVQPDESNEFASLVKEALNPKKVNEVGSNVKAAEEEFRKRKFSNDKLEKDDEEAESMEDLIKKIDELRE